MFNVGGGELIVIMVIALIVLGPKRLPDAARQIGKTMGDIRRLSSGFQNEIRTALEDEPKRVPSRAETAPAEVAPAEPAAPEHPVRRQPLVAAPEPAAAAKPKPVRKAPAAKKKATPKNGTAVKKASAAKSTARRSKS